MKVLLAGAGGQLGRELVRSAPEGCLLRALDRAALDVTDTAAVERAVAETAPEMVINAAAYTAVDRAEQEPELAFAVNAGGAENLARAAARAGARFIQPSTDFVFDGTAGQPYRPSDPPRPLGVYGASKLEGEERALAVTGGRALVLRTAWLYAAGGRNFVHTVLRLAAARGELTIVDDQVGTPTWAAGLARAIWRAATRPQVAGVHHWTDGGVASWYDFAVAIVEEAAAAGLLARPAAVQPIATADYPTPARRPAYGVLDKRPTWRALDLRPVHWRAALRDMLHEVTRPAEAAPPVEAPHG